MSTVSEHATAAEDPANLAITKTRPESIASTWVSCLSCIACIGIFIGLASSRNAYSWETLSRFGYLPANSIWGGRYWALVTSASVHIELWHVAFNVYWLWSLGSRMERAVGSLPFLAFLLISAFVSSTFQMAATDSTGIGASGVVYAIFGFMWLTRNHYSLFNELLDSRTIWIFMIWLFGCLVASFLNVWEVGNVAHFSGLMFGCMVAAAFVLPFKQLMMRSATVGMVALSIVLLFWCPWSITWLITKAYDAHVAQRYDEAIEKYTQIIHLAPQNAWAYLNRSYAYQALGQKDMAQADLEAARKIDPKIEPSK